MMYRNVSRASTHKPTKCRRNALYANPSYRRTTVIDAGRASEYGHEEHLSPVSRGTSSKVDEDSRKPEEANAQPLERASTEQPVLRAKSYPGLPGAEDTSWKGHVIEEEGDEEIDTNFAELFEFDLDIAEDGDPAVGGASAGSEAESSPGPPKSQVWRMLYVDPDVADTEIVARVLEKAVSQVLGCDCVFDVATNLVEALGDLREDSMQAYQALFINETLSRSKKSAKPIEGKHLAQFLRLSGMTHASIVLLVPGEVQFDPPDVRAHDLIADARAHGLNAVLCKPFSKDGLCDVVRHVCLQSDAEAGAVPSFCAGSEQQPPVPPVVDVRDTSDTEEMDVPHSQAQVPPVTKSPAEDEEESIVNDARHVADARPQRALQGTTVGNLEISSSGACSRLPPSYPACLEFTPFPPGLLQMTPLPLPLHPFLAVFPRGAAGFSLKPPRHYTKIAPRNESKTEGLSTKQSAAKAVDRDCQTSGAARGDSRAPEGSNRDTAATHLRATRSDDVAATANSGSKVGTGGEKEDVSVSMQTGFSGEHALL